MKIKIRNFRIFKQRTGFDIRPLTIFTGPNNAGKSALAKLFMLLRNNIYKLDFTKGIHRIPNFEKAVSFDGSDRYFTVSTDENIEFFSQVTYGFIYIRGSLDVMKIIINDEEIFSADTQHDYFVDVTFHYKKVIDIFLAKEYIIPIEFDLKSNPTKFVSAKNCKIDFWNYPDIDFSNYKVSDFPEYKNVRPRKKEIIQLTDLKHAAEKIVTESHYNELLSANALYNETEKLVLEETPYALFDIFKGSEKVTEQFYDKILEIQGEKIELSEIGKYQNSDFAALLTEELDRIYLKIKEFLSADFPDDKFEIKSSVSQNLIFREDFIRWSEPFGGVTLLSEITSAIKSLQRVTGKSEFVTINRGLQFREIDNPNYDLLLRYAQYKNKNKGTFIRKALEILGFPSDIVINQVSLLNGIGIADLLLETEKGSHNLQDLGYGFSMLLPILIQIELGGSPIFIEEPEANLHPNYQSLLADIFVLAAKMFPDQKIVLETHSEYLIRKLQLLTAQGKISPDKTMIYYFNDDKNVTEENPKVVEIEIKPDGGLTEDFGPGFYDEAVRLQFNLSNINREQMN